MVFAFHPVVVFHEVQFGLDVILFRPFGEAEVSDTGHECSVSGLVGFDAGVNVVEQMIEHGQPFFTAVGVAVNPACLDAMGIFVHVAVHVAEFGFVTGSDEVAEGFVHVGVQGHVLAP